MAYTIYVGAYIEKNDQKKNHVLLFFKSSPDI